MTRYISLGLFLLLFLFIPARTNFAQTTDGSSARAQAALLIARAKSNIETGDSVSAAVDLTEAIKLEPTNDLAYTQRARMYVMVGSFDSALPDAEKAIALNPKNAEALNIRGVCRQARNSYDAAITDYTLAIDLSPRFVKAYLNRGNSYLERHEPQKAAADFRKVLEIEPDNQPAKTNLAKAVAAQAGQKKAIDKALDELAADIASVPGLNKYPDAAGFLIDKKDPDPKQKFDKLVTEFNPLSIKYTEKVNAMNAEKVKMINAAKENKVFDAKNFCTTLVELDDLTPSLVAVLDKLDAMYGSGEMAKAISGDDLANVKNIIRAKRSEQINLTLIPTYIDTYGCRAKKVTLDNVLNAQRTETRNRIIEILQRLGNMTDYFIAGKRFNALTSSSTQSEICLAASEFKKESEKIEPILNEFAAIYLLEYVDPITGLVDPNARTVEFTDPEITKRAEKTVEFRTKIFLRGKEAIKNVSGQYGCK